RLRKESLFAGLDLDGLLDASAYIGRAPEQVDAFVASVVQPIRTRYRATIADEPQVRV
ncbi:MAG: adenylosuccinate lyase, partial [Planctomycetota bacterium]